MNSTWFSAVVFALATLIVSPAWADDSASPLAVDRSNTGGAQNLEDILARQAQLKVDESFRSENLGDPSNAA